MRPSFHPAFRHRELAAALLVLCCALSPLLRADPQVAPLKDNPKVARMDLDSVKTLSADIAYYLSGSEVTVKFSRSSGQPGFAKVMEVLQSLRLKYPGMDLGKDHEHTASSAASNMVFTLRDAKGGEFTLTLYGEDGILVETKDVAHFYRREGRSEQFLVFRILEVADLQKGEKSERHLPPPPISFDPAPGSPPKK